MEDGRGSSHNETRHSPPTTLRGPTVTFPLGMRSPEAMAARALTSNLHQRATLEQVGLSPREDHGESSALEAKPGQQQQPHPSTSTPRQSEVNRCAANNSPDTLQRTLRRSFTHSRTEKDHDT
jgi:hypothetical protein